MKTSFKTIFHLMAVLLVITAGTVSVQAQRGRGNDYGERHFLTFGHGDRYERHGKERARVHGRDRYYEPGYRYGKNRYYEPRYREDRVYMRRAPWGLHRPYIMNHNRGRLYYYGGRYYEYYPDRGYCAVEAPVGYEFDEVPAGFSRVWVDNAWCYHRGDFYLRPSAHGFISFNRPGISIGASF
jgi:hypothetical protein